MEPTDNYQQAVSLCTGIFGVLNHSNPQGSSVQILCDTILTWIRDSPSSPLLLPMFSAACSGLASMEHMVTVIETCIEVYFVSGVINLCFMLHFSILNICVCVCLILIEDCWSVVMLIFPTHFIFAKSVFQT